MALFISKVYTTAQDEYYSYCESNQDDKNDILYSEYLSCPHLILSMLVEYENTIFSMSELLKIDEFYESILEIQNHADAETSLGHRDIDYDTP